MPNDHPAENQPNRASPEQLGPGTILFRQIGYSFFGRSCMKKDVHILMLEDDAADAELTRFALRKGGLSFSLERVETKDEYLKALEEDKPTLILSDYSLPGFNGHAA